MGYHKTKTGKLKFELKMGKMDVMEIFLDR